MRLDPGEERAMFTVARVRLAVLIGGLFLLGLLIVRQQPTARRPLLWTDEIHEARERKTPRLPPRGPAKVDADQLSRSGPDGLPPGALARLGAARFRHRDLIQPVAFSPDGQTLLVGTAEHDALYAWDA